MVHAEGHGVLFCKPRHKICSKGHHAPISFLNTTRDHHASQTQGIRQHTSHTAGPIEKCTTKIHGAKLDRINAWCCLAIERRWSSPSGITPGTPSVHCHEYGAGSAATDCPQIVRRSAPEAPSPIVQSIVQIVPHKALGSVNALFLVPLPSLTLKYSGLLVLLGQEGGGVSVRHVSESVSHHAPVRFCCTRNSAGTGCVPCTAQQHRVPGDHASAARHLCQVCPRSRSTNINSAGEPHCLGAGDDTCGRHMGRGHAPCPELQKTGGRLA